MIELVSANEASKILRVTRQWISQLCREGKLDCIKVGEQWVIQRQSVLDYQASQRDKKATEGGDG